MIPAAFSLTRRPSVKARLLLCAVFLCSLPLCAQNPPVVTAQPNTVYVSAEGKFESAPDTAVLQFNVSAQEDTSKAAYDRASRETEQVRQILRDNGVEPKTAQIGFFSLQPVYDWRQPKRKLVGYRVNANVTLKLKDFAKVGPIVQQLGDAGFSENASLNYTLEDMDAAKLKAIEDAMRRAHAEAVTVAKIGGRAVGQLVYSSVDTFEQPRVMPMMMARAQASAEAVPAPTEQFSPQEVAVTARVNAVFALQ